MQEKKILTVSELLAGSDMKIFNLFDFNTNDSIYLRIAIKGLLAKLPSLKNGKMPGKNFLNLQTKYKLVALTHFFNKRIDRVVKFKPKETLYCFVMLPNGSRLDEDNGYASVKDWLEPRFKAKKDRGWGIGVVENDRYITGEARHAERLDIKTECAEIILRPYSDVKEKSIKFLNFARFV